MSIAASLTTELEKALRSYRIPILAALAFSFRRMPSETFLLTDDRREDIIRNIVNLVRVSRIQRQMTKTGQGVDERFFQDMSGLLLFNGIVDEDGNTVVQPNVTTVGGIKDPEGVYLASTGTEAEKQAKLIRYSKQEPGKINWRIRTPIMIAPTTSVIDYLGIRCNKLPFLHSVALKWSDRRWDDRSVPIASDLYRPKGEKTDMIVLTPVWMDESLSVLDPNIWGDYESVIAANYVDYLTRRLTEYAADLNEFVEIYQQYDTVLNSRVGCQESAAQENERQVGRLERRASQRLDLALRIPFTNKIRWDNRYRMTHWDPSQGVDVTEDVFNDEDVNGDLTFTSSFEVDNPEDDGWYGPIGVASIKNDTPPDLPPYTTLRSGVEVTGTKCLQVDDEFVARRLVLPDGRFVLSFWSRNLSGKGRIEIVRNTRIKPKLATMSETTSLVTDITHFRESYETVAVGMIDDPADGVWREHYISADLKDFAFVSGEEYPANEVYVLFVSLDGGSFRIDHLRLLRDEEDHDVQVINTASRAPFANLLPDSEKQVNQETNFSADDTVFGEFEAAGNFLRLDGLNTAVIGKHRNGYNLHPEGSSLNCWFKVNSEDETDHEVLLRRGQFFLFRKGSDFLPSYVARVNANKEVVFTWYSQVKIREPGEASHRGDDGEFIETSRSYRNAMLVPTVGVFDSWPFIDWNRPKSEIYANFIEAFNTTGQQPREWFKVPDGFGSGQVVAKITSNSDPEDRGFTDIGDGRTVYIHPDDPYITDGGWQSFSDPDVEWYRLNDTFYQSGGTGVLADGTSVSFGAGEYVTLWKYLEWHARTGYREIISSLESDDKGNAGEYLSEAETGFVFSPIAFNYDLFDGTDPWGFYSPSPIQWADASPTAPLETGGPLDRSPAQWPISPCEWGSPDIATTWPNSPAGFWGQPPVFYPLRPWNLGRRGNHIMPSAIQKTHALFLAGQIVFDRWCNFSFNADGLSVVFQVNGIVVKEVFEPEHEDGVRFTFNVRDGVENPDDLWIGTENPDQSNTGSPISLYSFKVYQRKLPHRSGYDVWQQEGVTMNQFQQDVFGVYLDLDKDKIIDFYQDDFPDLGMGVRYDTERSEFDNAPYPPDVGEVWGVSQVISADTIDIQSVVDRNYSVLSDALDDPYLDELITAQTLGLQDALIYWDFGHPDQADVHDFVGNRFVPALGCYAEQRLEYLPWLEEKVSEDFDSVVAITDTLPTLMDIEAEDTDVPKPAHPAFGDEAGEHFLTGVKGRFGFEDVVGYRDSLDRLRTHGIVFNYLQVEMRFRAGRAELDAFMEDFALSYDDLLFDDFEGHRLDVDPVE